MFAILAPTPTQVNAQGLLRELHAVEEASQKRIGPPGEAALCVVV